MLLADLRAAVHLVDHELRVEEHPDALNSAAAGELETLDQGSVLGNGAGSLRTTPIAP